MHGGTSQFHSVVVVLPETNSHVLTRELLYTAITRAQTHLTLVASEGAIRTAVMRPISASGLADALWPPSALRGRHRSTTTVCTTGAQLNEAPEAVVLARGPWRRRPPPRWA